MKKLLFIIMAFIVISSSINAQTKRNRKSNYSTYKTNNRTYKNGGQYKIQNGYQRRNGRYVSPHLKTSPDNSKYNNYKRRK